MSDPTLFDALFGAGRHEVAIDGHFGIEQAARRGAGPRPGTGAS